MPSAMGDRSTSIEDSARTSADGFIWSISGQAMAPAPTASVDQVDQFEEVAPRGAVGSCEWDGVAVVGHGRDVRYGSRQGAGAPPWLRDL